MCTAATLCSGDFYFGRNLDYEFSYGDEVTITPRNYPFSFRKMGEMRTHYAIIGMAYVQNDYPLYYDAINEKGLGVAGPSEGLRAEPGEGFGCWARRARSSASRHASRWSGSTTPSSVRTSSTSCGCVAGGRWRPLK